MTTDIRGAIIAGIEVPGLEDVSRLGDLPMIVLDRADRLALKLRA